MSSVAKQALLRSIGNDRFEVTDETARRYLIATDWAVPAAATLYQLDEARTEAALGMRTLPDEQLDTGAACCCCCGFNL